MGLPQDLVVRLPDSEEKEEAEVHLEEVLDHLEEAVAEEILDYSKPGGEELFLQNPCLGAEDHLLGNPFPGEEESSLHESLPLVFNEEMNATRDENNPFDEPPFPG